MQKTRALVNRVHSNEYALSHITEEDSQVKSLDISSHSLSDSDALQLDSSIHNQFDEKEEEVQPGSVYIRRFSNIKKVLVAEDQAINLKVLKN